MSAKSNSIAKVAGLLLNGRLISVLSVDGDALSWSSRNKLAVATEDLVSVLCVENNATRHVTDPESQAASVKCLAWDPRGNVLVMITDDESIKVD